MTTILDAGTWRRRMRHLLHHDQQDDIQPGCACGDPSCHALVPLIPAPRDPVEPFTPTAD